MNVPLEAPYEFAPGVYWGMSRTILRVTTSDGVVGLGETPSPYDAALLAGELGDRLAGRGVVELRAELGRASLRVRTARRGDEVDARRALVGVELALWDIGAREAGVPLYELLGGACRTEIPVSEYFAFRLPGPSAARREQPPRTWRSSARGWSPSTTRPCSRARSRRARSTRRSSWSRSSARRSVPERELRLDANMGWRLDTARRRSGRMAESDVANVEEPVATYEEMAALRRTCPIPFSTHDTDLERRRRARRARHVRARHWPRAAGSRARCGSSRACKQAGKWVLVLQRPPGPGDRGATPPRRRDCRGSTGRASRCSGGRQTDVIVGGPFSPERGVVPVPTGRGSASTLDEPRSPAASSVSRARASTTSTPAPAAAILST